MFDGFYRRFHPSGETDRFRDRTGSAPFGLSAPSLPATVDAVSVLSARLSPRRRLSVAVVTGSLTCPRWEEDVHLQNRTYVQDVPGHERELDPLQFGGDVNMFPVSRFPQPVGMVTTTFPWLPVSCDPTAHWMWLTRWVQNTPPLVVYPPTVWIPEHTHLIQWERRPVTVIHLLPPHISRSASLPHPHPSHPLPKLLEGWMSPEKVVVFSTREKHFQTNHIIRTRPDVQAKRTCLWLCPTQLSDIAKSTEVKDSVSPCDLPGMSQLQLPFLTASPRPERPIVCSSDGSNYVPIKKRAWPPLVTLQQFRLSPPLQEMEDPHTLLFTSQFSSKFTLLTQRHRKRGVSRTKLSYGGAFLLSSDITTNHKNQSVSDPLEQGDDEDKKKKGTDKRPVASSPVPGSPWCVVWTEDDCIFFFNPTIHLSVWEKPGELIGRDISHIIEDPPHKRRKVTPASEDKDDKRPNVQTSKRRRTQEVVSLASQPGEVQVLPLELRVAHFREMMLERGVSAFSTWEKELHKMVFDPRYLLLTPEQRKQVFDQFAKSRMKDEYKEKKNKLQKARGEFKQLLEEVKITSRSTFKQFCARYCSDHRFNALNRKQEQEVLFNHYVTSLKKRNKENGSRPRKTR